MKQVVRCGNCKRVIKRNGSYTANLTEDKVIGGIRISGETETRVVKLCPDCYVGAGYSPRGRKVAKGAVDVTQCEETH